MSRHLSGWHTACGNGVGAPAVATLFVNVSEASDAFTQYSIKVVNQWSLSQGVATEGGMDGLQVGTEYELMFDHTYTATGYHATEHFATFAVDSDQDTFLDGYEWRYTEGIYIGENSCQNQADTDAPTVSPVVTAPTSAGERGDSLTTSASGSTAATFVSIIAGVVAAVLQKLVT